MLSEVPSNSGDVSVFPQLLCSRSSKFPQLPNLILPVLPFVRPQTRGTHSIEPTIVRENIELWNYAAVGTKSCGNIESIIICGNIWLWHFSACGNIELWYYAAVET